MKFFERVRVATTLTGTGPATCSASAISAEYRTLAVAGGAVGDVFPYEIGAAGSAEWEGGLGTITAINSGAVTFSRTPTASSNGGSLVNFSAGTKEFVCTPLGATLTKWENGTSARVVFTSSVCVSDTDLSFASNTTGVDQRAKLQSLLDLAANGPLIVVWDGAYSVGMASSTTSLRIRSNTKVTALPGCGAKFLPESPVAMWRNYNPTVVPGNIVDTNIEIHGGIWHGNSANQSVRETAANGGTSIMDFVGVRKLRMTGPMQLLRARGFAWRGTNVYNVDIEDGTVEYESGQSVVSTDGYHFNGPSRFITIRNVRLLNCADDAIAFNADDAWVAAQNAGTAGPYISYGEISDVLVDGVFLQGQVCGIRMLSGASRMDRFIFRNIQGKTGTYWLIINGHIPADTTQAGPGNVGSVQIDGVRMENVPAAGWFPAQAHVNCKVEQLIFGNVTKNKFNSVLFPSLRIGESADIGQLVVDKYMSRSTNSGEYLTEQIHFAAGAKVEQVVIANSCFNASAAVQGYPIVVESGATIGQMVLNGNLGRNFTDFVKNNGTIGSFTAPAANNSMITPVVPTGWVTQSGAPWGASTDSTAITYNGPAPGLVASAKQAVNDAYGGNVKVTARVRFAAHTTVTQHLAILVRGSGLVPLSGVQKYFGCDIALNSSSPFSTVKTMKVVNGVQSNVSQVMDSGTQLAAGVDYDIEFSAKSSSSSSHVISIYIQRVSDQKWLQYDGTWVASKIMARQDNHTEAGLPPVSGEVGIYAYDEGDTQHAGDGVTPTISFSNFTVAAAP